LPAAIEFADPAEAVKDALGQPHHEARRGFLEVPVETKM
jgi:hypothetical protein